MFDRLSIRLGNFVLNWLKNNYLANFLRYTWVITTAFHLSFILEDFVAVTNTISNFIINAKKGEMKYKLVKFDYFHLTCWTDQMNVKKQAYNQYAAHVSDIAHCPIL